MFNGAIKERRFSGRSGGKFPGNREKCTNQMVESDRVTGNRATRLFSNRSQSVSAASRTNRLCRQVFNRTEQIRVSRSVRRFFIMLQGSRGFCSVDRSEIRLASPLWRRASFDVIWDRDYHDECENGSQSTRRQNSTDHPVAVSTRCHHSALLPSSGPKVVPRKRTTRLLSDTTNHVTASRRARRFFEKVLVRSKQAGIARNSIAFRAVLERPKQFRSVQCSQVALATVRPVGASTAKDETLRCF